MPKHFPLTRHTPANGVSARRVPGPMAPERCVTQDDCVSPQCIVLVGRDLDGKVRIRVELSREDASSWWLKVIRHWLAWQYSATEIKLVN
jgi:hypothetical protein